MKSLKEIGFDQYLQAEQTGWVLYLEGSTDLAILRRFAETLAHPAQQHLERPFVHYVANQPQRARDHFYGLREAKADLVGVALYDRLDRRVNDDPNLTQLMWKQREIENYLCTREVLRGYAAQVGRGQDGALFAITAVGRMDAAIDEITKALVTLNKPDPFGPDAKVSDEFLDPVFRAFFEKMGLPPTLMRKTEYHALAPFLERAAIPAEVVEKLDTIVEVASKAKPVGREEPE